MDIYNPTQPIYYVYMYLREDNTPYYVGKGKGRRVYRKPKTNVIQPPKDKSRIIIIHNNLSEIQSLILERYYIRWFGRKDNNTGILRNMTDGGEGTSGRLYSEETKSLISKKVKESIEYTTCPHCGKYGDKPNMMKYHFDNCGKEFTNPSASILRSKQWIIIDPEGNKTNITNLYRFCKNHPDKLDQAALQRVAAGKQTNHKGWKCQYSI